MRENDPLGLVNEQMELSKSSGAYKQGFYSSGCSFLSHAPAGHIGFSAFKELFLQVPSDTEEQGFLFTKEMLKQTEADSELEKVSVRANVSSRKAG